MALGCSSMGSHANRPSRKVSGFRSGPARCTPVKNRIHSVSSGSATGSVPRYHSSTPRSAVVAAWSTRTTSWEIPKACSHCSWSYWRAATAVSVNTVPVRTHSGK